MFKIYFGLLSLFLFSCSGSSSISSSLNDLVSQNNPGLLLVKNQLPAPSSFQSIQLYRKGNAQNPPILSLNRDEKLVFEFDELTSISGQFRIKFEHFDQNWNPSNIPEAWYLDGFNEIIISGGIDNALSKPSFFHYRTEFPNRQLNFLTSGNYMVHVHDYTTNTKLFSVPFFVSEQAGTISSGIETLFNSGENFSAQDQLFSVYEYPAEVEFPQFDLSFEFVQNRFWGSSKSTQTFDITTPDKIRFYTKRDNSFSSSFDFIPLDLTDLNINLTKIEDWQPEYTPPRVILKRDVLNFSAAPTQQYRSSFGLPEGGRNSRYASVRFQFVTGNLDTKRTDLYVAGDFNSWRISDESKLEFNPELNLWTTELLMKEGNYRYKYFRIKNSSLNGDALPINDSITDRDQEYIAFIYFNDPIRNYQRLLMTGIFNSRN